MTTISASDGSITAKFVSFGATMTELWVKDKFGKARDIILGYDDNVSFTTYINFRGFIDILAWIDPALTGSCSPCFQPDCWEVRTNHCILELWRCR